MKNTKKGFTVIEILIILAIIAILANFMIMSIKGFQAEARNSKVMADLKTIQVALEAYLKNNDKYPDTPDYQTTLINSSPRLLDSNIIDPFSPITTTMYTYDLSSDGSYYIIYSIGYKKTGYGSVDDNGTITASGGAIWLSNGDRS